MKLLFKQRLFSWLDSYDIYNENGETVFTVEGKLSFGHCLNILDTAGRDIGTVKEEVFSFLPRFRMYRGNECLGEIKKELTLFKPSYQLECKGWTIRGDFWEWDYDIINQTGIVIAHLTKEVFHLTDTYVLDIADSKDAVMVLMVALAIDAAKCSSSGN